MKHPSRRALLAAAVSGVLVLAGCGRDGSGGAFQSVDITGADYAKQLSLPDAQGRPRTLADFKGRVTVVFFGYTQCPDVCPTTMHELAQVKQALGAQGAKLQGVFVTVDPERDTPQVLEAYVRNFNPEFIALRGTPEQTREAAKEFKVFFSKVPGKDGGYTMDHTAGAFVFDAQGRVRLFTRYGLGAEALKKDLKRLLDESSPA
jgi:protein SCO1/2